MIKIITLFQRNYDGDRLVRNKITPGAEWVQAGEGIATRKWDGTCCMMRGGKLYKRYDAKKGRTPPANFEPAQDPDPVTGHWPGWVPVGDGSEDRFHRAAFGGYPQAKPPFDGLEWDGTYELIGPKVNGNPENVPQHQLIRHGATELGRLPDAPSDFYALQDYLATHDMEGIVWHHQDGRMVKIKARDFGIRRGGR